MYGGGGIGTVGRSVSISKYLICVYILYVFSYNENSFVLNVFFYRFPNFFSTILQFWNGLEVSRFDSAAQK